MQVMMTRPRTTERVGGWAPDPLSRICLACTELDPLGEGVSPHRHAPSAGGTHPSPPADGVDGGVEWAVLSAALRRFGLALTSSSNEADDLVQAALAKVMGDAPAYAMHAGYLRTTMTRLWMDKRRGARREMARLARLAAARVADLGGFGRSDTGLEQQEQLARVRAAMALLPPRQHAALALRLIEELDYPAIAETLGIAISAARANVHLARERVRKAMEDRA